MGTVTNQTTRITNADGGTWVSIGGGTGGSVQSDIFLQGNAAFARRQSNTTDHGFQFDNGTGIDLGAAGIHVGYWVWHTHYSVLTALKLQIGTSQANFARHHFPIAAYPPTGGWVRVWVNVSRTPDSTGGTGLDPASARFFGVVSSLPAVGGTSPNLAQDATDHTTAGLLLTGTAGLFSDFVAADEGTVANKYGVVTTKDGVIYCLARLTLGSSSSLVFSDDGFAIVFADQALVSDTFMGINVDLAHASTSVTWKNGVVRSAGAKRGDMIVTGTNGTFNVESTTLGRLRVLTLTNKATLTGCLISGSGLITANGAAILSSAIVGASGPVALLWNTNTDTQGKLDGTSFASAGTGHAIEFGSNAPDEISLVDVSFSGYGADGTTDAAIFNNSGKHLTINISGGTVPTVRNGTGSTTDIVTGVRSFTFTVRDEAGDPVTGYEWRLYETSAIPGAFGDELDGEEFATVATQNYVYQYTGDVSVILQIIKAGFVESLTFDTLRDADREFDVTLQNEEN